MLKEVKRITIVLENCETMSIEKEHIGMMLIDDIHAEIARRASNSISKILCSDTVALELRKEANNVPYYPFGCDKTHSGGIFGRLREYNDITAIEIEYDDGDTEGIYVAYKSDGDHIGAENCNQKSFLSNLGNLYIVIKDGKGIEDYFDMTDINVPNPFFCGNADINKFTNDNIPEMYRYVIISCGNCADDDYEAAVVMLVYDEEAGFTFKYPPDSTAKKIRVPEHWAYLDKEDEKAYIEKYKNTDFSPRKKAWDDYKHAQEKSIRPSEDESLAMAVDAWEKIFNCEIDDRLCMSSSPRKILNGLAGKCKSAMGNLTGQQDGGTGIDGMTDTIKKAAQEGFADIMKTASNVAKASEDIVTQKLRSAETSETLHNAQKKAMTAADAIAQKLGKTVHKK